MSLVGQPIDKRIYRLSTRSESGSAVRAYVEDTANSLRNSGCRHLLILVHGFNNSATDATDSYQLLIAHFEEHFTRSRVAPDAIAFFHWPGDIGGWFSLAGYPFDIEQAQAAAARLADYLKSFPNATEPGALKISLIGHSLGCRLILEMLANQLPAVLTLNIPVVSLMAPAVPIELVDAAGTLNATVVPPRRILKCYSRQDHVLWVAFPSGQAAAFAIGKETQLYREAIGLYGNPGGMGVAVETTNGHSDYWGDQNVANKFSAAIDPTFYTLPPPRLQPTRELPEPTSFAARPLAMWG
jgi:pimeloyl-ACP methyl ester carboxylesterase